MLSKKSLSWIRARVPISCLFLLALLSIITISPIVLPSTHAEGIGESTGAGSMEKSTDGSITNAPLSLTLSIANTTLQSSASEELNGGFSIVSTPVNIKVVNSQGFQVFLSSKQNSLVGSLASNTMTIPSITEDTATGSFTDNSWGYNFTAGKGIVSDSLIYHPIPSVSATPILVSTQESADLDYTLSFAAKFSKTVPADTYSGTVTMSLVANPKQVALDLIGMAKLDWPMQKMTPAICAASSIHDTARLRDSRDNNYYWVARLADGNCWMTQSLALDITEAGLSASNGSNVNWNRSDTYPVLATKKSLDSSSECTSRDNVCSWNLGKYVTIKLDQDEPCGGKTSNGSSLGVTSPAGCNNVTNVSTLSPYTGPGDFYSMTSYEQDGVTYTKPAKTTVDEANGYYDAHYLIGNYYSYNAATAGTGATLTEKYQIAPGNICPKGWDLPLSGAKYNNTSGSFYNLLNQYHLFQDYGTPGTEGYKPASAAAEDGGKASPLALVPGTQQTVGKFARSAPLYFAPSGKIDGKLNALHWLGTENDFYSSIYRQSYDGYALIFGLTEAFAPSYFMNAHQGRSVRCFMQAAI